MPTIKIISSRVFLCMLFIATVLLYQNCGERFQLDSAYQNVTSDSISSLSVCSPTQSQACQSENGYGIQYCLADGTALDCQLENCKAGFFLLNGSCLDLACSPGATTACLGTNGRGDQTCSANGEALGPCILSACNAGHTLLNGNCVPDACTPGSSMACSENNGTGSRPCNSSGTGFGACVLTSCDSGYNLQSGMCMKAPGSSTSSNGVIWAVGTCGHVEKSTDNGLTFQLVESITTTAGRRLQLQNFTQCNDGDHGEPSLYGLEYGNGRLLMASWNISGYPLGNATTNDLRLYSDDKGETWREFAKVTAIDLDQAFFDLSFSKTGGYFLGSTHYGNVRVMKSQDGLNWTAVVSQCTTDPLCKFRNSAAAGNYFIVGGDGNNFFSGDVNNSPTSQASSGNQRSINSGSRLSASTSNFGVLAGDNSSQLAVVDGRTGYSGSVNLSQTVSSGVFAADDKIFISTSNSIYRVDINCTAQNNCTGPSVRVAGINYRMGRMWYLNGYLYGVRYWSESDGLIYRSTTNFDPNSTASVNITFQPVRINATNPPRNAGIKKMIYIPQ